MTFLAAESSGSLIAFVANEGGVLTSSDNGSTWVQTSAPTALRDAITVEITGGRYLAGVQASGGRRVKICKLRLRVDADLYVRQPLVLDRSLPTAVESHLLL